MADELIISPREMQMISQTDSLASYNTCRDGRGPVSSLQSGGETFSRFPDFREKLPLLYPGKHDEDLHHRMSQRVLSKLVYSFICFFYLSVLSFELNILHKSNSHFRVIDLLRIRRLLVVGHRAKCNW